MALKAPCSVSVAPYNTGVDCQIKMSSVSLLILMDANFKWQDADEVDFLSFIETQVHATGYARWWPFFGLKCPVKTITKGKETDVTVTYDDGSMAFIRNGTMTKTLATNKGGLAMAKAFMSFNRFNNLAFIEVDKFNNVLRKKNADGSYSGIPLNMQYAPTPEEADFKTEFLTAFSLNYFPEDYIGSGVISASDQELRDVMGLIDAQITAPVASTTTILKIGVQTIGTQKDLVAAYPAIADLTVFGVTKKTDGTVVTPSAVAIVNGHVELTGVYTSGSTYIVSGTNAAALKALSILGYDISKPIEIAIP